MYLKYWQLNKKPFENSYESEFFYFTKNVKDILTKVNYCISDKKLLGIILGEYGSGKTYLVQNILKTLSNKKYKIIYIDAISNKQGDLFQQLINEFEKNQSVKPKSHVNTFQFIQQLFINEARKGLHNILVIDESQLIKDIQVFEDLQLLLNTYNDLKPIITTLLVGHYSLLARINDLPPVKQRISVQCRVEPLSIENTIKYIDYRLKHAGSTREIFTKNAIVKIYQASEGLPRNINNLCDMALVVGAMERNRTITEKVIESFRRDANIEIHPTERYSYEIQDTVSLGSPDLNLLNEKEFKILKPGFQTDLTVNSNVQNGSMDYSNIDERYIGNPIEQASSVEDVVNLNTWPKLQNGDVKQLPNTNTDTLILEQGSPGQGRLLNDRMFRKKQVKSLGMELEWTLNNNVYPALRTFFTHVINNKFLNLRELYHTIQILKDLTQEGDEILLKVLNASDKHTLIEHSVNVAVLASYTAQTLKLNSEKLEEIILCGLLHDIGILKVQPNIVLKKNNLTNEEVKAIKQHPIIGADIAQRIVSGRYKSFLPILRKVILQEHEREGGIGYPNGIMGAFIHLYAKIIGVCDVFETACHERNERRSTLVHEKVKEIIKLDEQFFSPQIKKGLVKKLTLYPLGCYVKLNTGEIGRVIGVNKVHPTRPCLEILTNSSEKRLLQTEVKNLLNASFLHVEKVVDQEDIR